MPWYAVVIIICLIIGPFDAFYQYIRASRRREALKRRREDEAAAGESPGDHSTERAPRSAPPADAEDRRGEGGET